MKKEIEVAKSVSVTNRSKVIIDLPETNKYYSKGDTDDIFRESKTLVAILPKYPNSISTYTLVQVERNRQDYDDFVPSDDCKQEWWLKQGGVRKKAFEILTGELWGYKEISKEEFYSQREELLNLFKND